MHNSLHTGCLLIAAALLAEFATPAWGAAGGAVLIGQPKNFPVKITQPGSYKLSENLIVAEADTTAIEIASDNVTIDFDGFSILGPVKCTGTPCLAGGVHFGVGVGLAGASCATNYSNITVRNGTIQGMGSFGLLLFGSSLVVEHMHVQGNARGGIAVICGTTRNATVRHNNVDLHCGTFGIEVGGEGFLVVDNVVTGCGGNGGGGIVMFSEGSGSVARNVVTNYNVGLALSETTGYVGNVLNNVNLDVFPGLGVNMGQNLCGTTACPGALY